LPATSGWIGGLSFFAFTAPALFVGWRLVFRREPYQTEVIPVWSCLVVQMVQGLQIDTDHWRHLYLLFGLLFGFAAADRMVRTADDGLARNVIGYTRSESDELLPAMNGREESDPTCANGTRLARP
jgi:hypothetical protein